MKITYVWQFNIKGIQTTTKGGWKEKHFFGCKYSNKEDMYYVAITLFVVVFGIGWMINK